MKRFMRQFITLMALAITIMFGSTPIATNAAEVLEPITQKVPSGSTVSKIASEANCSVSELIRMNPKLANNPNKLRAGDHVIVGYDRYWVIDAQTSTFSAVVRQSGLTSDEVKKLNPKVENYDLVKPGDKFYLGRVTTSSNTALATQQPVKDTSTPSTPAGYVSYTVQSGDQSVYALARRFGVSTKDLISPNPELIANPNLLVVGKTIWVPAYIQTTQTNHTSQTTTTTPKLIGSSSLSRPGVNRSSWANILLSASRLNGLLLKPGEKFNWFITMGRCGIADGYVMAGSYTGGKLSQSPGGGICFTSTGVMQAARNAGCTNMIYYDHSLPVTYATRGNEAAISWGSKNLIFQNPYEYSLRFDVYSPAYGELRVQVYAIQ